MGRNTIGAKIVLDGEKEYRSALKGIKSEQADLRSEMRLCNSTYKENQNTVEALTKKSELLSRQYEIQGKKVEACEKVLEKSRRAEEEAAQKVEELKTAYEEAARQLEEMENSTDGSTEALEDQRKEVEELRAKLELAQEGYEATTQKTQGFQRELNYAQADLQDMQRELDRNNEYLREATEAADGCATSIDQFGREVRDAGEETQEAGEQSAEFGERMETALNGIASALVATGVAKAVGEITDALKDCINAAKEFETSQAKLSTIADVTKVPLEDLRKGIMSVSSETGEAATQLAGLTYDAISAGVNTEKALDSATLAARLATAGFTDSGNALNVLTTIMNSYGAESLEAAEICDRLVATQNNGKTTIAELAASMGESVGLGATYKISLDNICAAMANVTMQGETTATASTKLKSLFAELGDAGSTAGEILDKKTGKSFVELMKEGRSLGDVLQIISDEAKEQNVTMDQLFNSTEAGIGAIKALYGSADKFNDVLKKMEQSTGATNEAFAKMANTTETAEKKMKNSVQNLKIAIGEVLRPAMEKVYKTSEEIMNAMTEFVEKHPEVVGAITALTIGLGVFTGAVTIATAATQAFAAIQALTNPTILLTGAVIGLASALVVYSQSLPKSEIEQTSEQTQNLIDKTKELNDTLAQSAETRGKDRESLELQAQVCKDLVTELENLRKKGQLTADEQARQRMIVDQLNEAMPELNLSIDEQTGLLNKSTQEIWENVEALQTQYRAEAAREDLKEIAKEQYEAEKQLYELQEQRAKQEEALAEAYKKSASGPRTNQEFHSSTTEIFKAQKAYDDLGAQIEETEATIAAYGEEYTRTLSYISDTQPIDGAAAATQNLGDQAEQAGNQMITTVSAAQLAYAEMHQELCENITQQMDLFTEFRAKSDLSTQDLLKNMQSQVDGITEWSNNLTELADRGIDQGLLKKLADMGPEGAGYVATFAEMTDEELKKANELWEQSLTVPQESTKKIVEAYKDAGRMAGVGFTDGLQKKYEEIDKAARDMGTGSINAVKKELRIQSTSRVMMEMGEFTAEGLCLGMRNGRPNVLSTISQLTNGIVTTTRKDLQTSIFTEIGKQITAGITKGLLEGKGGVMEEVKKLCSEVVEQAKKELDIHSPSKKFEYMGEMSGAGYVIGLQESMIDINGIITQAIPEITAYQSPAEIPHQSAVSESDTRKVHVNQNINIYAKTESLIDTSRQFKRAQQEAAAGW